MHPFRTLGLVLALAVVLEAATIPWLSVPQLALTNPAETALMRQRLREAEAEGKPLKIVRKWVPLDRIPGQLVDAVVVAEDGTFYSHGGFDWYEMRESMNRNVKEGRIARGGSTITQQLAKNLYLSTSKDPVRKLKEAVITMLLERSLSKRRIIELYLNVIEWGRGIFGAEAAAQAYFHKSCVQLDPDECARLAAVIPSPIRHRPDDDSRYVMRRTAMVQRRLASRARGVSIQSTEEDSSDSPDTVDVTATDSTDTGTE
jgi:monofunctional biosynthetic peptidoglycan transglycosylase